MPQPGPRAVRAHLRLAGSLAEPRRPENRALLLARAAVATVALVFQTFAAWVAAVVPLAPICWRRSPLGCRLRPLRPREAQVIPFQRRQVRQTALPR